ncbi:TPA: hypothetical protein RMI67_004513 [Bacillus cereus]|nr:hypothetical protein [Bacillus cereus]
MFNKKKITGAVLSLGILASGGILGSPTALAAEEGYDEIGAESIMDVLGFQSLMITEYIQKKPISTKLNGHSFEIRPGMITRVPGKNEFIVTGTMVHYYYKIPKESISYTFVIKDGKVVANQSTTLEGKLDWEKSSSQVLRNLADNLALYFTKSQTDISKQKTE